MTADSAQLQREVKKAEGTFKAFEKATKMVGKASRNALGIIATGAAGLVALTVETANSATELSNLSRVAGVSAEQLQKMSFGSKKLGIDQEKLADILKDTNDKIGDFLATGAGGAVDFFENIAPKVGVTAEQFRNLNSADALQLYISSLERANLSQAQMTFYMEALASDSTALIPLFRENGQLLREQADEAQRYGKVLSDLSMQELAEFQKSIDNFQARMSGLSSQLSVSFATIANDFIDAWGSMDQAADDAAGGGIKVFESSIKMISKVLIFGRGVLSAFSEHVKGVGKLLGSFREAQEAMNFSIIGDGISDFKDANIQAQIAIENAHLAWARFNGDLKSGMQGKDPVVGGGGGVNEEGGILGISSKELEAKRALLEDSFLMEHELLNRQAQDEVNILIESLSRKQITQEEFYKLAEKQRKSHADRMSQISSKSEKEDLSRQKSAFASTMAAASQHSRAMFNLYKAYKISEAIINAESAILGAFAVGAKIGGPPLGYAFGAAAAAATAINVAAIASQSFGSGGTSSGAPSAGAIPDVDTGTVDDIAAANDEPSRTLTINVEGVGDDELLSRDQLRQIIDEINEAEFSNVQIRGL